MFFLKITMPKKINYKCFCCRVGSLGERDSHPHCNFRSMMIEKYLKYLCSPLNIIRQRYLLPREK